MNLIDCLKNNAERNPTKIGFIDEERSLTFKEMYDEVQEFSKSVSKVLGTTKVVSLLSENSTSFVIAYLGIINSGRAVHLTPTNISESSLANQVRSTGSGMILCSEMTKKLGIFHIGSFVPVGPTSISGLVESAKDIELKVQTPTDVAYLIYTSGTTGEPKGVPVSHDMVEFTTKNIIDVLGYSETDIDVIPLPLYHSFGLGCLHTSIFAGSTVVLLKNADNLENILESVKKYNATSLAAVPATLTKLLRLDRKILDDCLQGLRLIITNSTSIPKNTVKEIKGILKGGNLATYYGLTEASRSTFMIFNEDSSLHESVGKPAPGVNIKIDDEHKGDSEFGEILVKGKNVIKKYWNDEKADKSIEDEWLRTGDVGYLDDDGYLFLKGRNDEVINVGGEKIIPHDIEQVVRQIPGVEDSAAFGIPHEVFGQTIKLVVKKSENSDLDKLVILTHCMKNLEKFKIPSKIEFVDSIPKNEYGKVKRSMLK